MQTKQELDCQLKRARKGDEVALAAIIARSMPLIRSFSRSAVRPGLDFDDAVQEGLIGLFAAIEGYDPENAAGASFATYSSTCIQNAIRTAQRAAGRKKHAPLNQSVPLAETQAIPGPEEQAIESEQVAGLLARARTRLSPLEKEVLALWLDGYSYAEIGGRLHKSTKSVENALGRIRRKLRQA